MTRDGCSLVVVAGDRNGNGTSKARRSAGDASDVGPYRQPGRVLSDAERSERDRVETERNERAEAARRARAVAEGAADLAMLENHCLVIAVNDVVTLEHAYDLGKRARWKGKTLVDNPHVMQSRRDAWADGWTHAFDHRPMRVTK